MYCPSLHRPGFHLLTGLLCALIMLSFTRAGEQQIEQARMYENSRKPVLDTDPSGVVSTEMAPGSPGDNRDLGEQWLLKYQEKVRPFELALYVDGYHTNNVALTENNTESDQFLVGEIAARYEHQFGNNLLADITLRQLFFRYNEFTDLDFDSQNAGAGLTWLVPSLWDISFFGRYNYNRLLEADSHDEIFTNHALIAGFQKAFVISRAHYFYAGYSSQFSFAHPQISERNEHGAYAGYHVNLTRALQGDFFYRAAWFHYTEQSRNDLNQTISADVQYFFTKWLNVHASASLTIDNSDTDRFDYTAFTCGAGIACSFKF